MPRYAIQFFCNECSATHPTGLTVVLIEGPLQRASLAETYKDKAVPSNMRNIIRGEGWCPKAERLFLQDDLSQVFLVPQESSPRFCVFRIRDTERFGIVIADENSDRDPLRVLSIANETDLRSQLQHLGVHADKLESRIESARQNAI
jgi:hypothetical protein